MYLSTDIKKLSNKGKEKKEKKKRLKTHKEE